MSHTHEDMFRDMLREAYGYVDICGGTYDAAQALEEVDPIAYRVSMVEYDCEEACEYECAPEALPTCAVCDEDITEDGPVDGLCVDCGEGEDNE